MSSFEASVGAMETMLRSASAKFLCQPQYCGSQPDEGGDDDDDSDMVKKQDPIPNWSTPTAIPLNRDQPSVVHHFTFSLPTDHQEDEKKEEEEVDYSAFDVLLQRHRVRFDEWANKEYIHPYNDDMPHVDELWYTDDEIVDFRREQRDLIQDLRHVEEVLHRVPDSWIKSYKRAYRHFCQGDDADKIPFDEVMQASSSYDPHTTTGTERKAIKAVAVDTTMRRTTLYEAVYYWQDAPLANVTVRQYMIRQAAREITRPSRLYAAYGAAVAVAAASSSTTGVKEEEREDRLTLR